MRTAGPWEPAPRIAVAVSGGADSLALALLAARWARAMRGEAVALTVDHALRTGSGAEAREVGRKLKLRGMRHHVLQWRGAKPDTGIQAAARAKRYDLLGAWCRRHGILHLLLAHHLEDQAETLLLRLGRGSGVDGLAAMAAVSETTSYRLVRPLLDVPQARLRAFLEREGVAWIDDPSNRDRAHARVRMRDMLPDLAAEGLDAARLARTARNMARARAALETGTAGLLARACTILPEGYCRLDTGALSAAPAELSLRALARVVTCIGGRDYPPRLERLERLHQVVTGAAAWRARTLSGCHLAPGRDGLLVCREPGAVSERLTLTPGSEALWDRRFRITVGAGAGKRGRITVAALGREGWVALAAANPEIRRSRLPAPVRHALPAIRRGPKLVAVPHLGYFQTPRLTPRLTPKTEDFSGVRVRFAPAQALAPAVFSVV
jgi:tRNA(Ile)-lysidine synthase